MRNQAWVVRFVFGSAPLWAGMACAPGAEAPDLELEEPAVLEELVDTGLVVEVSLAPRAPTVGLVSWEPPPGTTSWVEFGETEDYGLSTELGSDADGEALLFGMPGDTLVHFRVVVEDEAGSRRVSPDQTYTTGPTPEQLLDFEVTVDDGSPWGNYVVMAAVLYEDEGDMSAVALIIDRQGRPVWWTPVAYDEIKVAQLSLDGQAVMMGLEMGSETHEPGVLRVGLDGEPEGFWPSAWMHHDFMERADGSVVVLETTFEEVDGVTVAGDDLVELGADGSRRKIWSAFDELEPDTQATWASNPNLGDAVDWTHANGIDYRASTDQYLVSMYWPRQVVLIDGETGAIDAMLGGSPEASDYSQDRAASFAPQHSPRFTETGIVLFDNGYQHGFPSRVMALALDEAQHTATLEWEWVPTWQGETTTPVQGDIQLLDDGYWHASFGTMGLVAVVGPDGEAAWQAEGDRLVIGRSQVFQR